mmetsp:Transcript_145675/g.279342  ORF Transcript_145675/g.279342 Transcript_145675/m.279342 type:complete len:103 (+) Transcript_145675:94-402(+)
MARPTLQRPLFLLFALGLMSAAASSASASSPASASVAEHGNSSPLDRTKGNVLFQVQAEVKPAGEMTLLFKGRKKINEPDCSAEDAEDTDPRCLVMDYTSIR